MCSQIIFVYILVLHRYSLFKMLPIVTDEKSGKEMARSLADLILHKELGMLLKNLYDIYVFSNQLINFQENF